MTDDFQTPNPYESPDSSDAHSLPLRGAVKGKVMAPAIGLIVVGSLGLLASLYSIVVALTVTPAPIPPDTPEFLKNLQQGQSGPLAAAIQAVFLVVNSVVILGAVQMLRFKSWTLGLVATILAMVNIGTCCCVIGLPIGIWSLVILLGQDVKNAFAAEDE